MRFLTIAKFKSILQRVRGEPTPPQLTHNENPPVGLPLSAAEFPLQTTTMLCPHSADVKIFHNCGVSIRKQDLNQNHT